MREFSLLNPGGNTTVTSISKLNFGQIFSSNSAQDDSRHILSTDLPSDSTVIKFLSNNYIFYAHTVLSPQKPYGTDRVPPIFRKNCASMLTHCLFKILRLCFSTIIFPFCWKHAYMQTLPNQDDNSDP